MMNMVGSLSDLQKQGKCKHCSIPLFGYKNERRYVCGHCEPKYDMTGRYARKVKDYVPKISEISKERSKQLLEDQIDTLKREIAYWREKANDC